MALMPGRHCQPCCGGIESSTTPHTGGYCLQLHQYPAGINALQCQATMLLATPPMSVTAIALQPVSVG